MICFCHCVESNVTTSPRLIFAKQSASYTYISIILCCAAALRKIISKREKKRYLYGEKLSKSINVSKITKCGCIMYFINALIWMHMLSLFLSLSLFVYICIDWNFIRWKLKLLALLYFWAIGDIDFHCWSREHFHGIYFSKYLVHQIYIGDDIIDKLDRIIKNWFTRVGVRAKFSSAKI